MWRRTINVKGGSSVVSVPPEIIKHLGLGQREFEQLVFLLDPQRKYVMIGTDEVFDLKTKGSVDGEETDLEFLRFPARRSPKKI